MNDATKLRHAMWKVGDISTRKMSEYLKKEEGRILLEKRDSNRRECIYYYNRARARRCESQMTYWARVLEYCEQGSTLERARSRASDELLPKAVRNNSKYRKIEETYWTE